MKQITINIFKTVLLLSLFVGLYSCNEDKGNYDYIHISTVDSISIDDVRGVSGEILRVSPKLFLPEGSEDTDFTYTWYYRDGEKAVDKGTWELLQEGRNLEVEIADPIGKAGATYTLAFQMTNKITGITYTETFEFRVVTPMEKGYLALCEYDNGFDIDMLALTSDNKLNFYKGILELSGSELPREGVKPIDILTFQDPFAPNPYNRWGNYSVLILTDRYTTRVNNADYSWDESYDISNIVEMNSYLDREYVRQGKPIIAERMEYAYSATSASPRLLMYHKEDNGQGNWYLYSTKAMLCLFSVPMNHERITSPAAGQTNKGERYEPAPYIAALNNGFMYYDTEKKRILYGTISSSASTTGYNSANIFYSQPIPEETLDGAPFKYNDPNEGLLYMSNMPGNTMSEFGYAILKQADGSFKYIEFKNGTSVAQIANNVNTKIRASKIPAGSNIANAKFFAREPMLNGSSTPFLYYVTNDNKVMKVDVSNTTAVVEDITSSILTGDGYNEITLFKYTLPESNLIGDNTIKRALAVGTYNPSLGKSNGGKLEFYLPTNTATGNLGLAKYPDQPTEDDGYQIDMKWTDLGRIVGLSYKR